MRAALLLFAGTLAAHAQWQILDAHTTADLRGVDNVGKGVVWASGTHGTVLRSEDNGTTWQHCTIPPSAEQLDFRGVQAFDANTAIVMSSGKGDLSRLYKTTDGCQTWKLVFTNPDKDGFWDAIKFYSFQLGRSDGTVDRKGLIIGDPVGKTFPEFESMDSGDHWRKRSPEDGAGLATARDGEGIFAASNSSLIYAGPYELFVTGGTPGGRSRIVSEYVKHDPQVSYKYLGGDIPLGSGESAGAFSVATSYVYVEKTLEEQMAKPTVKEAPRIYYFPSDATCVVAGGDYKKPDGESNTAAWSKDRGHHWQAATTPPHGYRSAVAYDAATKTWITVGPNGTDISTDDGRNWRALKPRQGDAPDADQHWNALSLPLVVGPKGRIGVLRGTALGEKVDAPKRP